MRRCLSEMGEERAAGVTEQTAASSSCSTSAAVSPGGTKRGRDPEEEVYLDNFHSHKRYLSEIMASSLNGLSVGDSLTAENLMESPVRSESVCYPRRINAVLPAYAKMHRDVFRLILDELALQYSPMSEDSDDCLSTPISQCDVLSGPTSPVSPHRHSNPFSAFAATVQYPLNTCNVAAVVCPHQRQRGSDSEGRFPSSPNDMCHTTDLRRAALMRSVQMRTQPHSSVAYELPFSSGQENTQSAEEGEDRSFTCAKGLETLDGESGYQSVDNEADYIEDCSSLEHIADTKLDDKEV